MRLTRRQEGWDPFRELEDLSTRMHRFFGTTRSGGDEQESLASTDWAPSCDISETDKEYRIRAELPDVKKEDVHVRLDQGVLTIQGERREEREDKGVKFHRRETTYGSFLRRFALPSDADESQVDASFKDGMLDVTIARTRAQQPSTKEITIH